MRTIKAAIYKIRTLSDFLKVPGDRLKDCLAEFQTAIEYAKTFKRPDTRLMVMQEFTWIDDGKNNKTFEISCVKEGAS